MVRNIAIPIFFRIEEGLLSEIPSIIESQNLLFKRVFVVSGPTKTKEIAERLVECLGGRVKSHEIVRDNTLDEIEELEKVVHDVWPDLMVALGGGKVIDVVKMVSSSTQIPYISVPTTLSNDGIASPVATVKSHKAVKSVRAQVPIGVLVDIELVRTAPRMSILSGVGDLVANLSAVEDWRLASKNAGVRLDPFALLLSKTAAERFLYYVIDRGTLALNDPFFLLSLAEGLLLSGVAMAIAGNSLPASGAEHLISHALDELLENPRPHGIQVGIATLITMEMRGKLGLMEQIKEAYNILGFPTSFEEIGIPEDILKRAIERAPYTRPGRYTILNLLGKESESSSLS